MTCANCRWFDLEALCFTKDDDPEEAIGECQWPSERLPYSLRYGNRERMAVHPADGEGCAGFEPKESV